MPENDGALRSVCDEVESLSKLALDELVSLGASVDEEDRRDALLIHARHVARAKHQQALVDELLARIDALLAEDEPDMCLVFSLYERCLLEAELYGLDRRFTRRYVELRIEAAKAAYAYEKARGSSTRADKAHILLARDAARKYTEWAEVNRNLEIVRDALAVELLDDLYPGRDLERHDRMLERYLSVSRLVNDDDPGREDKRCLADALEKFGYHKLLWTSSESTAAELAEIVPLLREAYDLRAELARDQPGCGHELWAACDLGQVVEVERRIAGMSDEDESARATYRAAVAAQEMVAWLESQLDGGNEDVGPMLADALYALGECHDKLLMPEEADCCLARAFELLRAMPESRYAACEPPSLAMGRAYDRRRETREGARRMTYWHLLRSLAERLGKGGLLDVVPGDDGSAEG